MAASWGQILISNGTASSAWYDCPGGICAFAVVATFSGATIQLNILGPDGATAIAASSGTTMTASGYGYVYLPPCQVQCAISGGPPSGVYASIARVIS